MTRVFSDPAYMLLGTMVGVKTWIYDQGRDAVHNPR
jgi:hypothetical protein